MSSVRSIVRNVVVVRLCLTSSILRDYSSQPYHVLENDGLRMKVDRVTATQRLGGWVGQGKVAVYF